MCIICVKPTNVLFPNETILKNCFDNNSDGAGFMYVHEGKVHIKKGLMTFNAFKAALHVAREKTGDTAPYVLHFRISTQGFEKTCTHPFPLSSKMENLKKLKGTCNIGVAHNGIISLTSDGHKDYSDTMLFITDYLSLIIENYKWHESSKKKKLIEKLIGSSRLAILDKTGHIERLGSGWVQDKDSNCWFSNHSYSYKKYKWSGTSYSGYWDTHECVWDEKNHCWEYRKIESKKGTNKKTVKTYYDYDDYDDYLDDFNNRYRNQIVEPKLDIKKPAAPVIAKTNSKVIHTTHYWNSFKQENGTYDFSMLYCPYSEEDDDSYCTKCNKKRECAYIKNITATPEAENSCKAVNK